VGIRYEEGVETICRRSDQWISVSGETSPVSLCLKTAAFVELDYNILIPVAV